MKVKKVIYEVIEKCAECPYFLECEGFISCENVGKHFDNKEFKLIEKGFPNWCPLKDAK